jgi:uncharacterized membrane protein
MAAGTIIKIALIAALVIFVLYLVFTVYWRTFEILFGYGWMFFVIIFLGIFLSVINIPLYQTREQDIIFVNAGGCILPVIITVYLLSKFWSIYQPVMLLIGIGIAVAISRLLSWYQSGRGIFVQLVIIQLAAAFIALFLPFYNATNGEILPFKLAFGYIIGTIGVLVGADLLHLSKVGRDGRYGDELSIGGAGTNDGVWACGLGTMFFIFILNYLFGW